jgi:CheY-like chemotaxis protein/anti-sigma regulatory factor (Ser/Thr protein kinase)
MAETEDSLKGQGGPVTLLVVEAGVERRVAGALVEKALGWRVVYAADGKEALGVVDCEKPQLILTDLQMPGMDGLDLVGRVRDAHPEVPVVLMTAYGSEKIAIEALQAGAASYVPKTNLESDLVSTLQRVLAAARQERHAGSLLGQLTRADLDFALDNDRTLIPILIRHLHQYLSRLRLLDQTGQTRVAVALEEALLNAMLHGNLELSSDLRQDGEEPFYKLARERRGKSPYRERKVFFSARLSPEEIVYVIRDEGPGFDPSNLPDPTDPENLGRIGGRGLLLIRTFMDRVSHNSSGNEITLVKRGDRKPASWG